LITCTAIRLFIVSAAAPLARSIALGVVWLAAGGGRVTNSWRGGRLTGIERVGVVGRDAPEIRHCCIIERQEGASVVIVCWRRGRGNRGRLSRVVLSARS
jgi:hypothetical protein